ncbi:hypothetical protein Q9233_015376 [Columba guinea]|nr:hypothetical protein Q9233_015376 [Columba guinea]
MLTTLNQFDRQPLYGLPTPKPRDVKMQEFTTTPNRNKAATKPEVCSSLLASFEGKQVEVHKTPTSMLCRGLSQLNSPIYELLGPSTVVLRRYDTPLLPSTLAVKHLGKSNAFRSLTSKSSPHAFRCKAGKQETDISYQLSTQSSINISQSLR